MGEYYVQRPRTFVFHLKLAGKPFSEMVLTASPRVKQIGSFCISFPENGFNFATRKFGKKLKNVTSEHSEHSFLNSRQIQNHFLKWFTWQTFFTLIKFLSFSSLSQQAVSIISSFKIFKKVEKHHFRKLRTFVFEHKVASKPIFTTLKMKNCWYWQVQRLRKRVQPCHLKIFQEEKNTILKESENLDLILNLKVASKLFSKTVSMTNFWFK